MNKVKELLNRMDQEILDKVNAIVLERDLEIKSKAQEAFDNAVELEIASIKAEVEKGYATAREYLLELLGDEPVAVEPIEPVLDETSVQDDLVNGPEVL